MTVHSRKKKMLTSLLIYSLRLFMHLNVDLVYIVLKQDVIDMLCYRIASYLPTYLPTQVHIFI